ncbi:MULTISPECIES: ATP-binding cassette domain-containing protein [unclassified Actinobaculum]|uniref:ABC transporter ATP-binding protein n=1 Tax=unclassified Actinobaculum TaxID=2609299 RepID=UPI0013DE356F|nr:MULTISPECIES: ATP-binding cassette domain-containing protein [unclassified Actinobaculum]
MTDVEFSNVARSFGRVQALDGVSFQVPKGSVFALLGPNGAGKTTALRILLGLARADAGTVKILGSPPGSRSARSALGYLPDVPAFPEWMTAYEYLESVARLVGVRPAAAAKRIPALLEMTDLEKAMTRPIRGYSRGMRQRLGLAQALIGAPELLVLDEPTSALDPAGRHAVLELIARLSEHATIILSSHDLSDVAQVASHALVLRSGRALFSGSVAELRTSVGGHSLRIECSDPEALLPLLRAEPWCRSAIRQGTAVLVRIADADSAATLCREGTEPSGSDPGDRRTSALEPRDSRSGDSPGYGMRSGNVGPRKARQQDSSPYDREPSSSPSCSSRPDSSPSCSSRPYSSPSCSSRPYSSRTGDSCWREAAQRIPALITAANLALYSLSSEAPTLEDVFLHLTEQP